MAKDLIVNIDAVAEEGHAVGARFAVRWRSLTNALAMEKLGARLCVVPPRKAAWPLHRHYANEELVIVLSGVGVLRLDDARRPLRAGDCVSFPAEGPAHQILNEGGEDLVYWCVSTQITPDVFDYPDSGKFGVIAGGAPPGAKGPRAHSRWHRAHENVDYWDGER